MQETLCLIYLCTFILPLFGSVVSQDNGDNYYPTIILDNLPGSMTPILVTGLRGYIYSHDTTRQIYQPSKRYVVTLEAPEGYQISIESIQFDLGYPKDTPTCYADSLFLFNNEPNTKTVQEELPQGSKSPTTLGKMIREYCIVNRNRTTLAVSEKNSLTLYWHTVSLEKRFPNTKGFLLKWSTFRTLHVHGTCTPEKEFPCNDGQSCIPRAVACDTTPDCRDESDVNVNQQKMFGCENIKEVEVQTTPFSGSAVIGIIIGVLLAFSFIIAILVCCCKPIRRKQSNLLNSRNAALDYHPAPNGLCLGSNNSSNNCKHNRGDIHHECKQKLNQTNLTLSRSTGVGGDQNHFHKYDGEIV